MKRKNHYAILYFVLLEVLCTLSCGAKRDTLLWYKKGTTLPCIIIPHNPKGNEEKAAKLFQELFHRMTGARLAIKKETTLMPADTTLQIFIGNTVRVKQYLLNEHSTLKSNELYTSFQRNNLVFYAPENVHLLYGVCRFFEQQFGASYIDGEELNVPQQQEARLKEFTEVLAPTFAYRQAYFPASRDYNYMNFHGLQQFEEIWSVWGHKLDKILAADPKNGGTSEQLFALRNAKRNHLQYCFSSEALYQSLSRGIEILYARNEDLTHFNIAPNDNGIVCGCEQCISQNQGTQHASNSVARLLNRLAKRFPNLTFTTLAYYTTLHPTSVPLANNVVVMLSTIDEAKGVPLSASTGFTNTLKAWNAVCKRIYIWDYCVQYTNFNDPFPNLPVLQQDLQYFKKMKVQGVFEHGSEDYYSLFGDLKSYVLAKWFWNPDLNYDSLKKTFFQQAYPKCGAELLEFLTKVEAKQSGKIKLDIYGNMRHSLAYLSMEEIQHLLALLHEKQELATGWEKVKLKHIRASLLYDLLELKRMQGYATNGCFKHLGREVLMEETLAPWLQELASTNRVYTETKETFAKYVEYWRSYIEPVSGLNIAATKEIRINKPDDNHTGTTPEKALTDGVFGFHDYAAGYVVYDNRPLEIELPSKDFKEGKLLKLNFLQSPRHHLFFPSSFYCIAILEDGTEIELIARGINQPDTEFTGKYELEIPLEFKNYKALKVVLMPATRDIITDGSNKNPGIACDELIIL